MSSSVVAAATVAPALAVSSVSAPSEQLGSSWLANVGILSLTIVSANDLRREGTPPRMLRFALLSVHGQPQVDSIRSSL